MDNEGTTDWTATGLFSPSKARAQQAQAKDWAAVDTWLAKKYAPAKRPPLFERNEETLQALLTLATLNESADEQRSLVDRVHKAALQTLRKGNAVDENDEDVKALFQELQGDTAFDTLAKTAISLDTPDVQTRTLASAITDLTAQNFAADQLLQRAKDQLSALQAERRKANARLKELQSPAFQPPDDLAEQTTEWLRSTKQLKAKVAEYDERLASSRAMERPRVTLEDVSRQREALAEQQARLRELEVQLEAFQSLPSNSRTARKKVENAREELRELTRRRDGLFEELVDGE